MGNPWVVHNVRVHAWSNTVQGLLYTNATFIIFFFNRLVTKQLNKEFQELMLTKLEGRMIEQLAVSTDTLHLYVCMPEKFGFHRYMYNTCSV